MKRAIVISLVLALAAAVAAPFVVSQWQLVVKRQHDYERQLAAEEAQTRTDFDRHPVLSDPTPTRHYPTRHSHSDLPGGIVHAIALSPDGALWVGTGGFGVSRLDKEGQWEYWLPR